ncbi:MAG: fimbrial biogenesis outer membrane usher protein [Betaproteobacteria bacterium]|nr:fimbrial biogenesis outer membrane usher protein [Betaproteobacteria bacterium]MDE1955085.1 fimbrial biogenesis outer membrane usher protein [Betaproteobacteria bacterium]MDE2152905.1 fimbrial biogenesis outer membrane usher protein [Betaproteobacteria bacterium]
MRSPPRSHPRSSLAWLRRARAGGRKGHKGHKERTGAWLGLWLGACLAAWLLGVARAEAQPVPRLRFDPRLVFGGGAGAGALSRFEGSPSVPAGNYRSEIYFNGRYVDTRDVRIGAGSSGAADAADEVCLDRGLLRRLDLAPRRLRESARSWLAGNSAPRCLPPVRVADGLRASFDLARLRVDIQAPAVLLEHRPRGWVSPRAWSDGIVAGRLNYQFNAVRSHSGLAAGDPTQVFLGLAGGLNAGAWQLRHAGTLDGGTEQGLHYSSSRTDLRHDLARLGGYVQLGQGQTDGQLFDSVAFRGVLLASDSRMQPASRQGYAPVIHGFAPAASTVRVTQNGVLLYQTSVPAGAFEIDDLYAPAAGSALQVTVTPIGGAASRFTVPMSELAQLQRAGQASYQLMAGSLRGADAGAAMPVLLGTLLYGIDDTVTGEAGVVAARGYHAQVLGAAFNTRAGAFGLDLGLARFAQPWLGHRQGRRLRVMWNLASAGGGLSLSASRRSRGYYGPQDALALLGAAGGGGVVVSGLQRVRDELQLGLTQALGPRGSAYCSGSSTRYWDSAGRQSSYQCGYVRSLGTMQLTLSLGRQLGSGGGAARNVLSLGLSLPLGPRPGSATSAFGLQHDSVGGDSAQWSLSAGAGPDGEFSYGTQLGAGAGSRSAAVQATWRGAGGSLGAAATQAAGAGGAAASLSLSASGGLVAFGGGLTFTPFLGETVALVEAQGAEGAAVLGGGGSRIDSRGYGVAPYLTPYAADTVGIDPSNTALLERSSASVIPRAGAVVAVRLRAWRGRWALLSGRLADGSPLPFAAQVFDTRGRLVGYVGQGSRIDAHLLRDAGSLLLRWGDAAQRSCRIDYRLPPGAGGSLPVLVQGAVCGPPGPEPAR